jgi:hypothetical protein
MKKVFFFLLLAAGPGLSFSFKTPMPKTKPLEGTWKLVSANWYERNPAYANSAIYKIYTDGRFAFLYFDTKTGEFQGAGGGTYTVNGSSFTEKLEYFSWDSTAVGTSQTFQFKIEGERFTQSGLLNSEKYKNYKIEEVFERVESGTAKHPLVGVWQVESAQYGDQKPNISEKYGNILKFITPEYFYAVYFDTDKKKFHGVSFGKWRAEGTQYMETVLAFSWDATAANTQQTFTWDVKNNKFYQTGKINSKDYANYTIEEVSKRIE